MAISVDSMDVRFPAATPGTGGRLGSKTPFWPSADIFRSSPINRHSQCQSACLNGAIGLNRSGGRALLRAAWAMDGRWERVARRCRARSISPEPMMVQHDDRAISHRQRWERSFEYPNRCDLRCSHDIRRARNNSVGRHHVEIFVRPMRYKGCHQAHNAQVAICAFFTTPNPLKLLERRKAFSPMRKVRAISQKLYSHSQPPNPRSV
jgi:hypothetical protein